MEEIATLQVTKAPGTLAISQVNVKVFAVKSKILVDNGLTCDRYSNGSDIV